MIHEPSESSEDDSEDKSSPKSNALSFVVSGGGFDSVCLFVISSWPLFESSDSSSLSDEVDEDELESWFESDSESRKPNGLFDWLFDSPPPLGRPASPDIPIISGILPVLMFGFDFIFGSGRFCFRGGGPS